MQRKKFIKDLGISALGLVILADLSACRKEKPPEDVDFTIDLDADAFKALKSDGGFVYKDRIIIARVDSSEYIALSEACTHTGCSVEFDGSEFPCPCHGSRFNAAGEVLSGPARKALQLYNTSLNGNELRVFS